MDIWKTKYIDAPGTVPDALEDAPFKILINFVYLFFDSEILTREWIFDQFQ